MTLRQLLALPLLAFLAIAGCAQTETRSAAPKAASAAEEFVSGVRRTVLPNGLTVLVREQKGSGVVAVETWVKAGYFHEPDEVAGMAHLFEHMFFKGSKAYPGPEAIAEAIAGAGGSTNAGTIYDRTSYHVVVPRESLARAIEIQADAIAHPLFDPVELRKEAEVVIEESNRKYDNPGPLSFERMLATSFTRHRIKRWRIGSNEVLRNIRRDHLVAFFETLYRPENIIVSVAGDLDAAEALDLVRRSFGAIPRGEVRKERGPGEPPQEAFRFGRSEGDIKEGHTVFGWHTIAENHADEIPLEVLARLLGTGRSSRLYREAVGPGGASTIAADHETFEDVGFFSVEATHAEANRAEVERRVIAAVERMKRFGPTDYELALVKNIAEASLVSRLETALGQARLLAEHESRGSYGDLAAKAARLQAVTAAQVREVARRYLTLEKLTLYHYQPKGAPAVGEAAALARLRQAAATETAAPAAVALPQLANRVGPAPAEAAPRTFNLANGAMLVVQQRKGAPTASTGVFIRGGRTAETDANAGITRLMLAAMRRGTATRSGEAIDREIEFLGSQLALVAAEDGFGFTFSSATRFYEPALAILADVLLAPTFPAAEVAREKALQAAAIRRSLDSAIERPQQLLRAAMFPGHPYGLPELGTEASLARIDREALLAWWKATVAADRAMVVVVGDVDAEDVRRVIEAKLAAMPRGAAPLPVTAPAVPPALPVEAIEARQRRQTAMVIGFPAPAPSHPDWAALRLVQTLASGLSGTFHRELRSRQSLAYVVFASPLPFARQGVFIGYLATEAAKEATARQALLTEMRKLRDEGVEERDVARARLRFAGNTRIARERHRALVAEYGRHYIHELPLDHVDRTLARVARLGAEDLRRVARSYFSGDNHVYAAVRGSGG